MTIQELQRLQKKKFWNLEETEPEDYENFLDSLVLETAKLVVENLVPAEEEEQHMTTGGMDVNDAGVDFNRCRDQIINNARAMGIGE